MEPETDATKQQGQAIVAYRSPSRRSGFAALPNVVLLDAKLSDAAVRVYGLLLTYALQADGFYIYQGKIAEDLDRSVRAIQRALSELSDRGLITIERQGLTRPNIYWVEDAYALYDATAPATLRPVAGRSGDKNGVSGTTDLSQLEATDLSPSESKNKEKETTSSTFNVAPTRKQVSLGGRRQAALVEEVIALTGDEKSRKRYQQLAGIVLDGGAEALWQAAYSATSARLTKATQPLDAPGAYFCGTLAKLLGEAGVYVPVGSKDERDDVRAQIAASLGKTASASSSIS